MSARPRVSLNMIVKNEQANLRSLIPPIRHCFDELVIVDTGSTDDTRMVAEELGATVVPFAWQDDFSAARNVALDHSTGDWVMWLDADDRIDTENLAQLQLLLGTLTLEPRSHIFRCACIPHEASDPVQILHQVRLFPRRSEVRWERRVHEQILPSLLRAGCTPIRHDLTIRHLGYGDPTTDQRKAQRNLRLLRLDYATDPTDPVTLFYLGQTHLRLGQLNIGLTHLLNSRKAAPENCDWVRSLYSTLRDTLQAAGRIDEALAIGAEGLQRFPGDPILATAHANLLIQLAQFAAAERVLRDLLHKPSPALLANGSEHALDLLEARHSLGVLYQQQGRLADGERIFRELLRDHPTYLLAWVSLGYCCLEQGHLDETDRVAAQIDASGADPAYGMVMRAEVLGLRGRFDDALELVEHAIERAPRFPWARVVRANVLIRAGADRETCLAALRDVQRLSPECIRTARQIAALEQQSQVQSQAYQSYTVTSLLV